jgi:adenylosuccinate synthase
LAVTSVIGLQWGDEAKGKIVDYLAPQFDMIVRYQGGANAGHTVVSGDRTYKLHHVPSGILCPHVVNVIAPGVVLNPETLLRELDTLAERGVPLAGRLLISDRAHVVFPWHIAEDRAMEAPQKGVTIGTTLRGIGPCYRDKYGRSFAIRMGDLYRPSFRDRVLQVAASKSRLLGQLGSAELLDGEAIFQQYDGYARRLQPFVTDTTRYLLDALEAEKRVLFEGAQGSLLDIDHGTFPYVTSSNSSGAGLSAGSGVPARWIKKVIGVAKAYTTRVGHGPFPTELLDDTGNRIREIGHEYGTTTGRPRRCGWFDAVAVRYTARLGGIDGVSLMMLDVLSHLPELKVSVAYELDGQRIDYVPSHVEDLSRVTPVYETLPGWGQDITQVRRLADLPAQARRYVDRISQLVGHPVEIVSVGPDRQQTVLAGVP